MKERLKPFIDEVCKTKFSIHTEEAGVPDTDKGLGEIKRIDNNIFISG